MAAVTQRAGRHRPADQQCVGRGSTGIRRRVPRFLCPFKSSQLHRHDDGTHITTWRLLGPGRLLGSPLPTSVDDTLFLRTLLLDAATGKPRKNRRLFESPAAADLASNGGTNSVDYYTRNRLLSKIAGNTTNRSNVFIVWISVGVLRRHQPDSVNFPGVVQVGGQMADQPVRRGFFIVDRTLSGWTPGARRWGRMISGSSCSTGKTIQ